MTDPTVLSRLATEARDADLDEPWLSSQDFRADGYIDAIADFLAACSPAAILSLLSDLARAEAAVRRMDWLERFTLDIAAHDSNSGDGTGWAITYCDSIGNEYASGGETLAAAIDSAKPKEELLDNGC